MPSETICVRGLRKAYGAVTAIDGIGFEVGEGEVFGLLGPNGAGKTTTVEILEGLRAKTAGYVSVLGFDPATQTRRLKERIGVCLQDTNLADRAKVSEVLRVFASCYSRTLDAADLLKRLALWDKRNAFYASLSGGQKQRLALALALINDPQVIFLDEPSAGLDPQSRREIHEIIQELRTERRTILLTTHNIEEAAQLCDRVAILQAGRLVAVGAPSEIQSSTGARTEIRARCGAPINRAQLPHWPGVELENPDEDERSLRMWSSNPARTVVDLVHWLDERRLELTDIEIRRSSLEDAFLALTGKGTQE